MSFKKQTSIYQSISGADIEDIDLENDSDATLGESQHEKFPSNTTLSSQLCERHISSALASKLNIIIPWIRWGTVVLLQTLIIYLLSSHEKSHITNNEKSWNSNNTETGGDINGLYIPQSHKYTLLTSSESNFFPNMTSNDDRMEIRRNWDMLMPLGSGTVKIPDYKQYPLLGDPITDDPIRDGPIFEAAWTHALHCLYYTLDTYHQLVLSSGQTFGFNGFRNDKHAAHCFEYLRNQILCMADMTLEGSGSVVGEGKGQMHVCRSREEAIDWIEERRVDDIRSIVGP